MLIYISKTIIAITIVSSCLNLHGQSFFNIQPDVGGNDMQGVCRAIILNDSTFHIVGHRFDTSGIGSDAKPWIGEFNYNGLIIFLSSLIDTSYKKPFNSDNIVYVKRDNDNYYFMARRVLVSPFYTSYLFELNLSSGHIVKSKILPNSIYPNGNIPSSIIFEKDTITICSYLTFEDSIKIFITNLDTMFNELNSIEVKSNIKTQFPKYLNKTINNGYEMVAIQEFNEGSPEFNYWFVYYKIDSLGNLSNYKIAPTTLPISNNLYVSNCVLMNNHKDWVIEGDNSIFYPDSCMFCSVDKPYMFSVSHNFDSLLWETRFYDVPISIEPHYDVFSLTAVEDGYITTASFRNYSVKKFPDSGVLFKAGLNGDSMWMKHYIPLDWDEFRVVWTSLVDVKTTPFGSIIAAGEISDRDLEIIRPWILHLDKDGCLVPGCNLVSTKEEGKVQTESDEFKIYPNPASKEIYLLSTRSFTESVNIRIVSNAGSVMKQRNFFPKAGYQYSLPIDELTPDIYYLILAADNGHHTESHKFIKQ